MPVQRWALVMSNVAYDPYMQSPDVDASKKSAVPKYVSHVVVSAMIVAGAMIVIFLMYKLLTKGAANRIFRKTKDDSHLYSSDQMQYIDMELNRIDPTMPTRPHLVYQKV
ncbi:hypothetical protein KL930_000413 [Ogataea haglerorum]|uniref:Uncharacterized protein n=1 Tax=Ogataea haglerorum TaxID=1937702 RepID=A0AAN6I0J4_9ASCO|nr:uncharacterized protein KL911_000718 [Ogataea haglerorum]KAG7697532.1 hypothetical protein KL951_002106 [Ogataea haglerorum]KAG7701134.1 hypothetical protein KL915_000165 [Ogataea haglerorum]KAG7705960.1 hypothetical protein KL950_003536 [Ogataea haglerorum]KAG7709092.1 hypothetical protein KL914_001482 [Ogataea haglerorum]KAG7715220.1 hypothetical protein KL913_004052 [Ogataea haglerorum]